MNTKPRFGPQTSRQMGRLRGGNVEHMYHESIAHSIEGKAFGMHPRATTS
jgi:hypothetical protein